MKELATKEQRNEGAATSRKLCESREHGKLRQKQARAKTFSIIKTNGCGEKTEGPVSCNPRDILSRRFFWKENRFNPALYPSVSFNSEK